MRLSALYQRIFGDRLRYGLFRGMRYVRTSIGSSYGAKLLGTYEVELQDLLVAVEAKRFHSIVNVGAAEGYYAVGLALRHPQAIVAAFETESRGQELIRELATLNAVSERVKIAGTCDRNALRQSLAADSLVFMDAEGAEVELLEPMATPALATCTCVVEVHDFLVPGATALLRERFASTHPLAAIPPRPRSLADLPPVFRLLFRLTSHRYATSVLDEGRPASMCWLHLAPRKDRA